jgi:hypothetical protein
MPNTFELPSARLCAKEVLALSGSLLLMFFSINWSPINYPSSYRTFTVSFTHNVSNNLLIFCRPTHSASTQAVLQYKIYRVQATARVSFLCQYSFTPGGPFSDKENLLSAAA